MENWRVLLVDDEEEFVTTLAERLELRRIQAQTASNGDEALRIIESHPPQVVVLDVMMPGLSGMEVLQHIRTHHPNIQVILLTGHGCTMARTEGIRSGAFDCLAKPVKIEELMEKIREAIGLIGNRE